MLPSLKPTDAAIERLALDETDPVQRSRFTPLRWGFLGNLLLIIIAGGLGLVHAAFATAWRGVFRPKPNASG